MCTCKSVHAPVHVHAHVNVCVCVRCYKVSPEEATPSAKIKCPAEAPVESTSFEEGRGCQLTEQDFCVRECLLPVTLLLDHRQEWEWGETGRHRRSCIYFCLFNFLNTDINHLMLLSTWPHISTAFTSCATLGQPREAGIFIVTFFSSLLPPRLHLTDA